jgi:hypothetical protein
MSSSLLVLVTEISVHATVEAQCDRRNDFIVNHNESDLRRPEIEPLLPDLQSNALPISLHLYELHQILY